MRQLRKNNLRIFYVVMKANETTAIEYQGQSIYRESAPTHVEAQLLSQYTNRRRRLRGVLFLAFRAFV